MVAKAAVKASKPTLLEKVNAYLIDHGVSRKKAEEITKGLVQMARRTVVAEVVAKTKLPSPTPKLLGDGSGVIPPPAKKTDALSKFLRTDLPVVPKQGGEGVAVMCVMDGLTSTRTYITTAVKGKEGIVAVRALDSDIFNVKFYPTFKFWGVDVKSLRKLGAFEGTEVTREHYQRMHFSKAGLDKVVALVNQQAKVHKREKNPLKRLLAVTLDTLFGGFTELYGVRR